MNVAGRDSSTGLVNPALNVRLLYGLLEGVLMEMMPTHLPLSRID